jgi:hypothetical protein
MGASGELVAQAAPPMTIASLRERSTHVQALIRDLMVEGVHYMVIPGTKERSLTKMGSELLLCAFHIAVDPEVLENSDADAVRYTVRLTGRHMGSGLVIGVGIGRCSSNEEKYKWRRAVCREEFDATPETHRRLKWGSGERGVYSVQQVRTNPEDVANTVLKMAKKRAQADLCLTALGASDAFKRQPAPPKPTPPPTNPKGPPSAAPGPSHAATGPVDKNSPAAPVRLASPAQVTLVQRKLDQAGLSETYFLAQFEIGRLEELTAGVVDHALAWIASQTEAPP